MECGQQIFSSAQNPIIHSGNFTNVSGNATINQYRNTSERPGLRLLLDNIALGAFHDAAERGDPPKCHPRTRVAICKEIMQWIRDPGAQKRFITWLYGPAGSGKTAIAQSISEACAKEGLLAASFFFGRLAAGRNTSSRFVATIAYQLAKSIPEMEERLLIAIENEPTIFSRSLSTQMEVLVIEPLMSLQLPGSPKCMVMDGIDECGPTDQAHAELLKVLGTAITKLRNIPIVLLIASRPEYEIRMAFNKIPFSSLTKSLVLDNKYKLDKDIQIYLKSKFRKIRQDHLPLSRKQWPAKSDISVLISKASGQFIFAATVIKFVDSPRDDPAKRLKIILGLASAGTETPFALLDALYRFILGSVADYQKVLDVLTLLLLVGKYKAKLTLANAEELLGFDIRVALIDMHALLFVPPPTENDLPRIYHASLYDFLMDRSRSISYYIDKSQVHIRFSRRWLKIIGNCAESQIQTSLAIDAFKYHCGHLRPPANNELVEDLAHFDWRASLERISNLREDLYLADWPGFLRCVKHQVTLRGWQHIGGAHMLVP